MTTTKLQFTQKRVRARMKVARMRIKGETPSETTTHSNRIEILTDSIEIMVTTNNLLHLEDLMFPLLKK